jgi:alkylhydroperoxidase family enzyme
MNLTIHAIETAPPGSKADLEELAAELGFVPNLAAVTAGSPVLLAAFATLRRTVGSGDLSPVLREIAGLAVGIAVDNAYGVAFHSTVLSGLGIDEASLERMRAGRQPAEPGQAATYRFARELVAARGVVSDETVALAHAAGLTTSDLLEIVAECTFATLVGLVDNLAGRVELDGFLQPQAWATS